MKEERKSQNLRSQRPSFSERTFLRERRRSTKLRRGGRFFARRVSSYFSASSPTKAVPAGQCGQLKALQRPGWHTILKLDRRVAVQCDLRNISKQMRDLLWLKDMTKIENTGARDKVLGHSDAMRLGRPLEFLKL